MKSYRLYDTTTRRIFQSRSVIFHEHSEHQSYPSTPVGSHLPSEFLSDETATSSDIHIDAAQLSYSPEPNLHDGDSPEIDDLHEHPDSDDPQNDARSESLQHPTEFPLTVEDEVGHEQGTIENSIPLVSPPPTRTLRSQSAIKPPTIYSSSEWHSPRVEQTGHQDKLSLSHLP